MGHDVSMPTSARPHRSTSDSGATIVVATGRDALAEGQVALIRVAEVLARQTARDLWLASDGSTSPALRIAPTRSR